jgi:hypothetical protein
MNNVTSDSNNLFAFAELTNFQSDVTYKLLR